MEEERDEQQGIDPESGIIWTLTHEENEASDKDQQTQDLQDYRGDADGEEASKDTEDLYVTVPDVFIQETLTVPQIQVEGEQLPQSPPTTDEVLTPLSASSLSSLTQGSASEPCFYCLRSLDSYQPEDPKQEDLDASSPSSVQKMSYQTDPRPHFGVAWSSHSTCRPLWGSEGPCWGPRNQEVTDQIDPCPHCHLGLPPDTLRWHEAKCLLFEGLGITKK
ncbi:uncharacterized protein LOC114476009 [Gouania willdenowi]|uniref:uncharacterized protein LOC114476009 n=1 Tax=Gouania willdenowi TaxID=441366 RepID=UPI001055001C|nr:uncharacterized protein LOC114476009 [Gouania willdenowi]